MKYVAIATVPVEPILKEAKKRFAALVRSKNAPIDKTTMKPYTGDRKKEYLLNLAKSMAIVGAPLDSVHEKFLDLFRDEENVNIEVEIIGITDDKKDFSYGVELVFDDTYFILGYHDANKTKPEYERVNANEFYETEDETPEGDTVGMRKRQTLARKVKAILEANNIEYNAVAQR